MGLLSRLFGRPKAINVVAPLDPSKGTMVLTQDVAITWRRSQTIPDALRDEIVEVCRADAAVDSVAILDVLEQPTGNIKIFVTLGLDHPEVDLYRVGAQLQQVFGRYAEFKDRYFIGSNIVADLPPEAAAYRRLK